MGLAASFGAFLLAGGAKGKRIALPNAEIMIHQPAIGGKGVSGQATDIQIMSDHIQKSKERLNRIPGGKYRKNRGENKAGYGTRQLYVGGGSAEIRID